jgi:FkbM family methyltransferase
VASINPNVLGLCEVDGFRPWEQFKLNEDSFVVDLGAFRGDFSRYILDTYNCRVDAYEPLTLVYPIIHPKFIMRRVPVFDGSRVAFKSTGPASHILGNEGEPMETMDIRKITTEHIHLMKINIEGAEIRVLELADLRNVDQILVEFHLFRACKEDFDKAKQEIEQAIIRVVSFGFKWHQIDTAPSFMFWKP